VIVAICLGVAIVTLIVLLSFDPGR